MFIGSGTPLYSGTTLYKEAIRGSASHNLNLIIRDISSVIDKRSEDLRHAGGGRAMLHTTLNVRHPSCVYGTFRAAGAFAGK